LIIKINLQLIHIQYVICVLKFHFFIFNGIKICLVLKKEKKISIGLGVNPYLTVILFESGFYNEFTFQPKPLIKP